MKWWPFKRTERFARLTVVREVSADGEKMARRFNNLLRTLGYHLDGDTVQRSSVPSFAGGTLREEIQQLGGQHARFVDIFGHEQADVIALTKQVADLAKLVPRVGLIQEEVTEVGRRSASRERELQAAVDVINRAVDHLARRVAALEASRPANVARVRKPAKPPVKKAARR